MELRLPENRRRRRLVIVAIAIAISVGYYLLTKLIPQGELHSLLEDLSNTLGAWTYLLVGVFAFAETGAFVGLVVPGETVMLLGGAVAGQGAINLYILIGVAWFAAWAGDTTSFFIGRRLGRGFVLNHGPRFGVSHERFEQVEDYFDRHGGKTIFIGRFIGLVRAFAPFIAGSSGMRYRAFVPYSILGTGIWASIHILIGYLFSRSIDTAAKYAGRGAFVLATVIVIVVVGVYLYRRFRVEENRRDAVRWMEERTATRWLVVLVRRFQPELKFVWDRVTPGGTFGLEFTSLMAALAVGTFVLIGYISIINGDPGPTPGDEVAAEVVEALRTGWLTDITKVVTVLGSPAVVLPLAGISAAVLALRRRWAEVAVLVIGMAIVLFGVHEIKAAVDRPRPEGSLVDTSGSSFPSGHAAYATFYLWLAMMVVIRVRPGISRGAAIVTTGLVLTALVGLSRVYLGAHYLSDVSGGWALGAAAFSLCAAIALVVTTLRQNGRHAVAGRPEDRE
jgi:undecaprenyl-diphosphatase